MPASKLRITYFPIRGRAEPMRLSCVLGDLEFEDDRVGFAQFPEVRKTTPYLAVPLLWIDGKSYAQSNALLRYLGKETGLYPESPKEALKVDEAVDALEDFFRACFRYMGPDKEVMKEERRKLVEEDMPRYIGGLEKRLPAFGEGPFLVGNKITIADTVLVSHINNFKSGFLEFVDENAFEAYPRMMEAYRAFMKEPKVVDWYKKNPIPNVPVPLSE